MKNPVIGKLEQEDLKKQVAKVLRGLGNPEPPLNMLHVRDLLKLDVRYYSSTNDSFLQETISRMKIAGKQIIKRPSLLLDVIKKAKISALWIPDHKRILIDQDSPKLKHRWYEGHEIGHSLAGQEASLKILQAGGSQTYAYLASEEALGNKLSEEQTAMLQVFRQGGSSGAAYSAYRQQKGESLTTEEQMNLRQFLPDQKIKEQPAEATR